MALAWIPCLAGAEPRILVSERWGCTPDKPEVAGEYLYFGADDGVTGRELWRIDKNNEVRQVLDAVPGPESGNPKALVPVGEGLCFIARKNVEPVQYGVYYTEGSAETTREVLAIADLGEPNQAVSFDGKYVVLWVEQNLNLSVWWVDLNTSERVSPPVRVSANLPVLHAEPEVLIIPGHVPGAISNWFYYYWRPGDPAHRILEDMDSQAIEASASTQWERVGSRLYFAGGRGIYMLDLVPEGELRAKLIFPTLLNPLSEIKIAQDNFFLSYHNDEWGKELWTADISGSKSSLVVDLYPGRPSSSPYWLTTLEDSVVFAADSPSRGVEVWRSDGTPEGTILLTDQLPGPRSSEPYALFPYKDLVLFSSYHDTYGEELWKTDGTPEGTVLVKDIHPGSASSEPYYMTFFNDKVYFSAQNEDANPELWETDGTEAGTRQVTLIHPPARRVHSSDPRELTRFDDRLFFSARAPGTGRELWCSDGTEAGTFCFADLEPGNASSNPEDLQIGGEHLYFTAEVAGQRQWWRTGATPETIERTEAPPVAPVSELLSQFMSNEICRDLLGGAEAGAWAEISSGIVFGGWTNAHGAEPYFFDAATQTVALLRDIIPGPGSSGPRELVGSGQEVYFRAYDLNGGAELYKSDGTHDGTIRVVDHVASPLSSAPSNLTPIPNGIAHFTRTVMNKPGLAVLVDDTPAYTTFQWPWNRLDPRQLGILDDGVYLVCDNLAYGNELWRAGNREKLPHMVRDIYPSEALPRPGRPAIE